MLIKIKKPKFSFLKNFKKISYNFEFWEKINKIAFPYLLSTTYIILFLEAYTYRGFIQKYTLINTTFIFYLTIISVSFLFIRIIQKKSNQKGIDSITNVALQINKLITIPLVFIYYILLILEDSNFPNYVFSEFHLALDNFALIVTFNLILTILILFFEFGSTKKIFMIYKFDLIRYLFYLSILFFLAPHFQNFYTNIYIGTIKSISAIRKNYDEKMVIALGGNSGTGWIYTYSKFINKYVPENGTIFIPPQKQAWQMEGNRYYFRWYVYPRKIVTNEKEIESPIPPEADYVLISYGAWIWNTTEYVWPRIHIPMEKIDIIYYINRDSLEETEVKNADYTPNFETQDWGIIELKK